MDGQKYDYYELIGRLEGKLDEVGETQRELLKRMMDLPCSEHAFRMAQIESGRTPSSQAYKAVQRKRAAWTWAVNMTTKIAPLLLALMAGSGLTLATRCNQGLVQAGPVKGAGR